MIYHENPNLDFQKEKDILSDSVGMQMYHEYVIYENQSSYMNEWLYTNLKFFGNELTNKEGEFDENKLKMEEDFDVYYKYDTYIKLSDYNYLLKNDRRKRDYIE